MKPEKIFLRTEFNYDMFAASDASGLKCEDKSLTHQSFKEETDINTIVERFHITGELPTNVRMPTYDDFVNVVDFQTAMNQIALANEAFDKMPANVRARFDNDPNKFVDFCSDQSNATEAAKLGLITSQAADLLKTNPPAPIAPEPPLEAPKGGTK